jgi:tetratricopeptide (TPR) repeat protein
MSADRNLLFGILAVQLDFVSKDALIAAMNAWLLDKGKPLGDILRDLGGLSAEELQHLDALVAVHLRRHGGEPLKSLAALSSVPVSLQQKLAALPDEAVQRSIARLASAKAVQSLESDPNRTVPQPPPEKVRYRILRPHARGGLGEVFVAEDAELGRNVALKEIQTRFAGDSSSRERFVREAEITGGLEHPGIVPVYGLGTYADGRPFYAMRFIKGDNLRQAIRRFHGEETAPQDRRYDSIQFRQLLQRFIDVCNAIAYAHSRGVLHRDLKPGNIMLGKYGETLVVDWGLAKPTGRADAFGTDPDADATLVPRSGGESSATVAGQALGTPAYMSPEQAAGKWDQVGPTTDIYSLGATLYELLTGRVPFQSLDLDAVQKGEFPRPRSVIWNVPQSLEAVCLKAMALEPAARYGSALDLAKEVERWQADEPVAAWPEPWTVRGRRWVRRHRTLVTTAAAVMVLSTAGLASGLYVINGERKRAELARSDAEAAQRAEVAQRRQADINRDLARENERQALRERNRAESEKSVAIAVRKFLQNNLLRPVNVREQANAVVATKDGNDSVRHDVTVRELLAGAAREFSPDVIGQRFPDQPEVQAEVLDTIGEAFESIGDFNKSVKYVKAACAIREKYLGIENSATIVGLSNLVFAQISASQFADAATTFLRVLQIFEQIMDPNLGAGQEVDFRRVPTARLEAAFAALDQLIRSIEQKLDAKRYSRPYVSHLSGDMALAALRLGLAIPRLERYAAVVTDRFGEDDQRTWFARLIVGFAYYATGRVDRAADLFAQTLAKAEAALPPGELKIAYLQTLVAAVYQSLGKNHDEVIGLRERAYTSMKSALGPDHPATLDLLAEIADDFRLAGKADRAIPLLQETLRIRRGKLGPDHPEVLVNMDYLAMAYQAAGKTDLAIPLFEETLRLRRTKLGPDHQKTLSSTTDLAYAYLAALKADQALPLLQEVNRLRKARLGPDHADTLTSAFSLAVCEYTLGKPDLALPLLEETFERMKAKLGPENSTTLMAMNYLASCNCAVGNIERGRPLYEEWIRLVKAKPRPNAAEAPLAISSLANAYFAIGKFDQALPLYEEVFTLTKAKVGPDHPDTWTCMTNLAGAYEASGKPGMGLPLKEEVVKRRRAKQGPEHPDTLVSVNNLAVGYYAVGKFDQAVRLLEPMLDQCRAKLAPNHLTTLNCMANLAIAYLADKEPKKAIPLFHEYLDGLRRRLGETRQFATTQASVALKLIQAEEAAAAESVLRECLAIREKTDPNLWTTFNTKSMLGASFLGQKKFAEAEPLLLAGYEGMRQRQDSIPSASRGQLIDAMDRLVRLYDGTGPKDKADTWRAMKADLLWDISDTLAPAAPEPR